MSHTPRHDSSDTKPQKTSAKTTSVKTTNNKTAPKQAKLSTQPDHAEHDAQLFALLQRQNAKLRQFDRVLWWVLPLTAFLLSVVCANLNWPSTLGTFVVMLLALCAVGIYRVQLIPVALLVVIYAAIDNVLSHGQFNGHFLALQLGAMLIFVVIVGLGRPYMDSWLLQRVK